MADSNIQQIFQLGWKEYSHRFQPSLVQAKAAHSLLACKTGSLGCNISICKDCGHTDVHANSCRNRNCPNCQAVLKELWVDQRRAEVIHAPYFHVVFTVPASLNSLIYANQALLYSLLHKCSAETLLELSANPKYLGATPGVIQVLHTWGQELNFHPHIHCIVSGGGLTRDQKLKTCGKGFFLPAKVLASKFRGKLLSLLDQAFQDGTLTFPPSCEHLSNPDSWQAFKQKLYNTTWCPDIRETFNGFGNAIEYLGRYTHRIAITNTRIRQVTSDQVTFTAKDYKNGGKLLDVTLSPCEFVRRFMMHVLPARFQKIRYYGFLSNRNKRQNLRLIFRIQGRQSFQSRFFGLPMEEVLKQVWGFDIRICPVCGGYGMRHAGRTFAFRN